MFGYSLAQDGANDQGSWAGTTAGTMHHNDRQIPNNRTSEVAS
ncbi:MAG: hypothetical protein R2787_03430 [Saprospiraceae bacterium]